MRFDECRKHDATALAGLIARRDVSPEEVLEAAIARAEEINPAPWLRTPARGATWAVYQRGLQVSGVDYVAQAFRENIASGSLLVRSRANQGSGPGAGFERAVIGVGSRAGGAGLG